MTRPTWIELGRELEQIRKEAAELGRTPAGRRSRAKTPTERSRSYRARLDKLLQEHKLVTELTFEHGPELGSTTYRAGYVWLSLGARDEGPLMPYRFAWTIGLAPGARREAAAFVLPFGLENPFETYDGFPWQPPPLELLTRETPLSIALYRLRPRSFGYRRFAWGIPSPLELASPLVHPVP